MSSIASPDAPTVLLVEASSLKRMALAAYLRTCGYEVVETSGPVEARRLIESGMNADVVFIDLDVDGKIDGGFSLAQWIRGKRPGAKVLLTSGVRRAAEAAGKLCEQGPHLGQPYAHRNLEAQIRRLLAN